MEIERRTILTSSAAAGAVIAAGLVSGCESRRVEPRKGPGTIKKSEVPVGGGVVLQEANFVVTQPTAGTFVAFAKQCPHAGCAVSSVGKDGIVCPCHNSVFDPSTGKVKSGPATTGLGKATVTDKGDTLEISA